MKRQKTIEKIQKIQHLIAIGKTKTEVAHTFGYKDTSSLYRFASRNGLTWNEEVGNYISEDYINIDAIKNNCNSPKEKPANIIRMFKKGVDGREIAKLFRYRNMQEMANYMRQQGYHWNDEQENYVFKPQVVEFKPSTEPIKEESQGEMSDFFKLLNSNKDKLKNLLSENEEVTSIPRYLLSGVPMTKTISIIDSLNDLTKDYCRERNITQRTLIEVAIINFLKHYGYKDEVKAYLNV